jgi:O-antigen/teichoic acid export membrane protein
MLSFIKRKYHNLTYDTRFYEIFTGSVWALSARVIAAALGLTFSLIVARLYGAKVVGTVAVINSLIMLATIFTLLGTNNSILRLIPEHLAKYSPTSAFWVYRKTQYMVIAVSVLTAVFLYFGANLLADKLFSKPNLSYYFALSSVFVVFQSIMNLNTQAVRGLRLIKIFAFMQILPQTSNLLFLMTVGMFWTSIDIPIYAVLFGFTMTGISGWFIMEIEFKKRTQPDDQVFTMPCRDIIRISLPMLMAAAMMFFITQTGVLMLGMFRTEAEVGYYSIAGKLANLASFVIRAVDTMAAPKYSELFHKNKMDELFHLAKKSTKLIFFTTTPILLCFIIFGKPILNIVFGPKFVVAYPALVVLVIGTFVNSISGTCGTFLNMTGKQIAFRNIVMIVAIFNILLNLWFIPLFGINGAAVSAMASLWIWNLSILVYMKLKFGKTTGYFPILAK